MSIHKTDVIVLRKRDFRETSLIVEFFSRDYGKLSGILKGIRKDPRKFASTVEPFSLNEIVFYRKRSTTLHLVSQCDAMECFVPLRGDMMRSGIASFMMELLGAVMPPEDPHAEVFDFTCHCLNALSFCKTPARLEMIYKIKMLALSGFKPHFDSCVLCSKRIMTECKFSLGKGGLVCPGCSHRDTSARQILRGTIATILYIERNDLRTALSLGMNQQIKRELELILNGFLQFHLDRRLKSQKVLRSLEAVGA